MTLLRTAFSCHTDCSAVWLNFAEWWHNPGSKTWVRPTSEVSERLQHMMSRVSENDKLSAHSFPDSEHFCRTHHVSQYAAYSLDPKRRPSAFHGWVDLRDSHCWELDSSSKAFCFWCRSPNPRSENCQDSLFRGAVQWGICYYWLYGLQSNAQVLKLSYKLCRLCRYDCC